MKPIKLGLLVVFGSMASLGQKQPILVRSQPKTLSSMIDFARPSVVQIQSYFGVMTAGKKETGTGFFVNSEGIVVTAKHVVSHGPNVPCDTSPLQPQTPFQPGVTQQPPMIQASFIWVAWPQTSQTIKGLSLINPFMVVRAQVIACDDKHDIALLKPVENPITMADQSKQPFTEVNGKDIFLYSQKRGPAVFAAHEFRDGDPIFTSGYPLTNSTLITTSGYIASSEPVGVDEKTGKFEDVYWADINVNPGNSGGPAFSLENGAVIGIVLAFQTAPIRFNQNGYPQAYTLENGQQRALVANAGIARIVPAEFIKTLLRDNRINFTGAPR